MKPTITVVALGPGSPEYLTMKAAELLTNRDYSLIVRTGHHPCAAWLIKKGIPFRTLDDFYDQYDDFNEMYTEMASFLWNESKKCNLLYAVPDLTNDLSVQELRRLAGSQCGKIDICPGLSYPDLYLPTSAETDLSRSVCIVPAVGIRDCPVDPSQSLLITELNDRITAGEVKLFLSDCMSDETQVMFMTLSEDGGIPSFHKIPLCELDRQSDINHTSALFIPGTDYLHRDYFSIRDLGLIMNRLRAMNGCPWDKEQTHESLRPYLVEEAWEAVSAINDGDMDHLADELGDVLLQIVFHVSIAESFEEFTMSDVAGYICRKMIRRHPHIFGNQSVCSSDDLTAVWENVKRQETGSKTVGESLSDVSPSLPSLKYAIKVNKKVVQLSEMKRDPNDIVTQIRMLADSLIDQNGIADEEAIGNLLMKCTQLCQRFDIDAEIILHNAVEKFIRRFQKAEKQIFADGKKPECLTFHELCVYFNCVEGW